MNRSGKIEVLKKIRSSEDVLFGCFSKSLTKQQKIQKWQEIHIKAQALGVVPTDKDYRYTRDTFWQNVRKNAMKKKGNAKKTGSEGGPDCKFTESDNIVFDIIGKDSSAMVGLPVKETWEQNHREDDYEDDTSQITDPVELAEPVKISSTMNARAVVQGKNQKKEKLKEEDELKLKKLKLSVEIMEKESYLKTLEMAKLEKELGTAPSKFTENLTSVDYLFVEHISDVQN